MVCLGNICRSPLAEGILDNMVKKQGLNWQVDSAGTSNYHIGEPPHHLSQKVAKVNGIDISAQRCRQFKSGDMNEFDRIYVMDQQNYADVKRMCGSAFRAEKTSLILSVLPSNTLLDVPDPWYGDESDYHHVFQMLTDACEQIILQYSNTITPSSTS